MSTESLHPKELITIVTIQKIGLWSDAVNFPSLPLMKLSAYYKAFGCDVKLIDDFFKRRKIT